MQANECAETLSNVKFPHQCSRVTTEVLVVKDQVMAPL